MRENEMIPVIERVLEKWAGSQVNLASQTARGEIARKIAEELVCSIPVSPLSGRRRVSERRDNTIDPFDNSFADEEIN